MVNYGLLPDLNAAQRIAVGAAQRMTAMQGEQAKRAARAREEAAGDEEDEDDDEDEVPDMPLPPAELAFDGGEADA